MNLGPVFLSAAAVTVLASANHFAYAASGENALVGIVSPTSESVFSHMKMMVVPYLIVVLVVVCILKLHSADHPASMQPVVFKAAMGLMAILVFIPASFYSYTSILEHNLAIDIALTFAASVIGMSVFFGKLPHFTGWSLMIVTLLWMVVCSVKDCDPLFEDDHDAH
jgi:hypothetical protein